MPFQLDLLVREIARRKDVKHPDRYYEYSLECSDWDHMYKITQEKKPENDRVFLDSHRPFVKALYYGGCYATCIGREHEHPCGGFRFWLGHSVGRSPVTEEALIGCLEDLDHYMNLLGLVSVKNNKQSKFQRRYVRR